NNGREGLFINIQALSIKFFGSTVMALKLASIIFGTLTVLGVYLLSKEIFRSQRAGLISAYLTTFSYWAINFSRIGFRAIMVPLIMTFSSYFLLKGFRTKKYSDFIISGLIFGLGFHTYIAFRIAPAIIAALFVFMLITQKHFLRSFWKQILIFSVAVFISLSPMVYEFYNHPEYLESRSASVSIFSPEMNEGSLIQTGLRSFGLSLVKYNFWGDQNWRHNYPPYPILDPVMGIAFLTGIIYVISKALHLLWLRFKHDVHDEKLYLYFFLLAWFFAMLAPEFLTAEGLPHALRAIGTLPVVMILATIPFLWLLGKLSKHTYSSMKITIFSILVGALIFIGLFNTLKYFVFFQNNPKQHSSFNANLKDIAYHLQTIPVETQKYVISGNMERIPIKYLNPQMPNISYLYKEDFLSLDPKGDFVVVMYDKEDDIITKVRSISPQYKVIEHEEFPGDKFWEIKK
ncbi:MAG: hypothetical protein UW87_C0017G0001, partial [Candidatus Moranbacteria bacterium GW2011_GWC2_45_10]